MSYQIWSKSNRKGSNISLDWYHIPSFLTDPKSTRWWHVSFFLVGCRRFDGLPLPLLDKGSGMSLVFVSPYYPWVWALSFWNACGPGPLLCSVSETEVIKRKTAVGKTTSSHFFKINKIETTQANLLNYLNLNIKAFYILPYFAWHTLFEYQLSHHQKSMPSEESLASTAVSFALASCLEGL